MWEVLLQGVFPGYTRALGGRQHKTWSRHICTEFAFHKPGANTQHLQHSWPCKLRNFKGNCHEMFDLHFSWFESIWAPDKQAKVFSNSVSISPRFSITKLSTRCAAHRGDTKMFLVRVNQHFILQIFSFIIDVFVPKGISSDCPIKTNQRQV